MIANQVSMFLEEIENKDGFYAVANLENTLPQTAANYGIFFIAIKPCEVLLVKQIHGTASTSGTVTVEKLTGTTAKGSGTAITNAMSTSGTANTVATATLVAGTTQLAIGDRLAIKNGGTLTNGKDLQLTVYLKPLGKGDYR